MRSGEVVGIAGVSGNGQKELLYALSGEDTRAAPAMIQVFGQDAARMGPGYFPLLLGVMLAIGGGIVMLIALRPGAVNKALRAGLQTAALV